MSFVAIIGSGPLGGAIAHTLAARDRVGEVRLIDAEERIAQGKALDILQSSPIEDFSTRVVGIGSFAGVAGARRDRRSLTPPPGRENSRAKAGLALLRQIAAVETPRRSCSPARRSGN